MAAHFTFTHREREASFVPPLSPSLRGVVVSRRRSPVRDGTPSSRAAAPPHPPSSRHRDRRRVRRRRAPPTEPRRARRRRDLSKASRARICHESAILCDSVGNRRYLALVDNYAHCCLDAARRRGLPVVGRNRRTVTVARRMFRRPPLLARGVHDTPSECVARVHDARRQNVLRASTARRRNVLRALSLCFYLCIFTMTHAMLRRDDPSFLPSTIEPTGGMLISIVPPYPNPTNAPILLSLVTPPTMPR